MSNRIRHPYSTYIRRAFCFPRLWGFTSFSEKHAANLRNTNKSIINSQTLKDFPYIGKALRKKNISQVIFSGEIKPTFVKETKLISLLAEAIRGTIRDLATYGIPKTEKTLSVFSKDKYNDIKLEIKITLKPANKTDVEIEFETNFFMNGYARKPRW